MPTIEKDDLDLLRLKKEIWEKAVDTQMHFNEMSVKSRQLGLSFVVAALGLAVVLLTAEPGKVQPLITLPLAAFGLEVKVHVSALVVLIAAAALHAVRVLDMNVYHRMLRGAVTFGEELEQSGIREQLMTTPKGMTEFISLYSRYREVERVQTAAGNEYRVCKKDHKTAEQKIRQFYMVSIAVLVLIFVALAFIFGESKRIPSPPNAPAPHTEQKPKTAP